MLFLHLNYVLASKAIYSLLLDSTLLIPCSLSDLPMPLFNATLSATKQIIDSKIHQKY